MFVVIRNGLLTLGGLVLLSALLGGGWPLAIGGFALLSSGGTVHMLLCDDDDDDDEE